MLKQLALVVVLGTVLASGVVQADTIALNQTAPLAGTQAFTGSLGEDFSVGPAGIKVTSLGAFDSNQDGLNNAGNGILTQIFNNATGLIVPGLDATVTTANSSFQSAADAFRFITNFTPVTLAAGSYRVVGSGYDASEFNGNTGTGSSTAVSDTGGGLVSFPATHSGGFGNSYRDATPGIYPIGEDGTEINRYLAGSFTFVAVPEPAMVFYALIAISALLAQRRVPGESMRGSRA